MTALRQRFIEDLQLRNRSPRTIECYVFHLAKFAAYFGQAPDRLGTEQVHQYLVHLLHKQKASWSHYNQAVSALRFFYRVTCPQQGVVVRLPYGKRPRKLPTVRSADEVARFLARHGTTRVAKAVLIGAVPPIMLKSERNPEGTPKKVFDEYVARLTNRPARQRALAKDNG